MRDDAHVIQLRPATPADVQVAAILLYSAYTHTQVTYPPGQDVEPGFVERLEQFFRADGNRFSYQHIQVAFHGSDVVGLASSFGGRDETQLNAAVSWLAREAEDDEWYVDALAVLKDWGHRGIGARLLLDAERQAREHGYAKIALSVARENTQAMRLYTRLGYVAGQRIVLYGLPYVRMAKTL